MKLQIKKFGLQIGGFLTSIAPIAAVVACKWTEFTCTTASTVSLGVGGGMAAVLVLMKSLGKTPAKVKPIIGYGIAFMLVSLLQPLIMNLQLLLGAALAGEFLDWSLISWRITRTERQINAHESAIAIGAEQKVQTQEIVSAISKIKTPDTAKVETITYDNSGRV